MLPYYSVILNSFQDLIRCKFRRVEQSASVPTALYVCLVKLTYIFFVGLKPDLFLANARGEEIYDVTRHEAAEPASCNSLVPQCLSNLAPFDNNCSLFTVHSSPLLYLLSALVP